MISHKPLKALMKESVILEAQKRTKAKIEAKKRKARTRDLTVNNVITTFNMTFKEADFGDFPPLITEKTRKMLLGWVKLAKKEHKEAAGDYFYPILLDFVKFFDKISQKRFFTLNRRNWRLSSVPDLRDLVICRDSIIKAIAEAKEQPEEEDDEREPKSLF
jgi:hypothetical protein